MITQNKGNKNQDMVHHLQKFWLILNFCGSAYPKFGMNQPKGGVRGEILKLGYTIVYINGTIEFLMFILVSKPFKSVTGELEGVPLFLSKDVILL